MNSVCLNHALNTRNASLILRSRQHRAREYALKRRRISKIRRLCTYMFEKKLVIFEFKDPPPLTPKLAGPSMCSALLWHRWKGNDTAITSRIQENKNEVDVVGRQHGECRMGRSIFSCSGVDYFAAFQKSRCPCPGRARSHALNDPALSVR